MTTATHPVFECSYCDGLMQVNEAAIPAGLLIRVRCPHCQKIGLVGGNGYSVHPEQPVGSVYGVPPEVSPRPPFVPPRPPFVPQRPPGTGAYAVSTGSFEPTESSAASAEFRFPSESTDSHVTKKQRSLVHRLIIYMLISLAVIAAFALIVNIVLPGPA